MNGNYVAYYRVSTERQGQSGLGLDAQRSAVVNYLDGGNWKLIAEFTEVESGKHSDRAQLRAAQAACKKHKATLVIAKLDRLSRNVHFLSGLMEAGTKFIAVDNPNANKLTIHILAAVAEDERERISARTKAALAAARARGQALGNPRLAEARAAVNAARQEAADVRGSGVADHQGDTGQRSQQPPWRCWGFNSPWRSYSSRRHLGCAQRGRCAGAGERVMPAL